MLQVEAAATQALLDLFSFGAQFAQAGADGRAVTVACGDHTYAKCPEHFEGCFDYSPMFCGAGAVPKPAPAAPAWQPAKQAPAALWLPEPAANTSSRLPLDVQFCVREACDALSPVEASLCYCQGTADDPGACDPPLGLAQPLAMLAHAACSSAAK